MLDNSGFLDYITRLNYSNSFKVFILSLIGSCETALIIILGGMDILSKVLLIVIILELVTYGILDYVKYKSYRKISNLKLLRKLLIILTVGLAVLIDILIKEYGGNLGIKLASWASIRTYVILHWVCREGIDTLDNIDSIGNTTGKWNSPTLLKDIFSKLNKNKK